MFFLGFSVGFCIKKRVVSAFFAGSYLVISPIFSQCHPSIGLLYVHPPAFYAGLRRPLCGMLSRIPGWYPAFYFVYCAGCYPAYCFRLQR